tara:strand:- start:927 stop:1772 length:846 start_codon:yes stop_codon:yes gene_type:complete
MSRNNEIFNQDQPGVETPAQQTREQASQDLGFDIPVETVPLPSQGLVYPAGHPLHMKTSIDIRAMTAREEDILTSRALIKSGTVISALINSCITNKDVDASSLLSGDRNAIMTAIRITGYGAEYEVDIECPECTAKQKKSFNLSALPINSLQYEPDTSGNNKFSFQLPASKKTVTVRFATGQDEEEATITEQRKKKQGLIANTAITDRLFNAITAIDGIEDRPKIRTFITNMPARDSLTIRAWLDKNEPSVSMDVGFECDVCAHEEEMPLPMGATFFWPQA